MYRILIIALFFFIAKISCGQILDSANIRVSYTVYFKPDSTSETKKDDIIILEFGDKISKCYSYYRFLRDSLLTGQFTEQQKIGAAKYSINLIGFNKSGPSIKLFRNSLTGVITVTDRLLINNYMYKDSLSDMKWNLFSDTMTVLGYLCSKATTTFRGRAYSVWFTNEIPVPYGPMKFGGLPGLIISLKEDKGNFEFYCHSIEFLKTKIPIQYDEGKYNHIYRKEHRQLVINMIENPDAFADNMGLKITTISSSAPPKQNRKVNSNPLELE